MPPIYAFKDLQPVIHETAFVHPMATVTGDVVIGRDVYIGPGAAVRGDFGRIIVEDGCNIQENCTIHMFPGVIVRLEKNAHIGHGAIIHGAHIGANSLIGMNSVIMDNVVIGEECIIGALSFIKADSVVERRSLMAGNPARFIREVSDEMMNWKTEGTLIYQQLARDCHTQLRTCEPLRELPETRAPDKGNYCPWNDTRSSG